MSEETDPIANGSNGDDGRDTKGRFAVGNKGGPGSPVARHARQLRERLNDALFKVVSPDRLVSAIDACLKLAEAGDVQALKLLLDRIAGPPVAADLMERLEALEEAHNANGGGKDTPWTRNHE